MDIDQRLEQPSSEAGREIEIEGVFNVRSFGGYTSTLRSNCTTRQGFLYRSGHLEDITSRGIEQLRGLGITTIINLTNTGESTALFANGDTATAALDDVKVVNLPLAKGGFSVEQLAEKYRRYLAEGEKVIAEGYITLLAEGHAVVRDIILHIRDYPKDVVLIHCSMGKDRTGVIFAILLALACVSHDDIAREYSLSESVLEAAVPEIAAGIKRVIEPPIDNVEATSRARIVIQTRYVMCHFPFCSVATSALSPGCACVCG
ncbi:tyrosine phosphatase family-domain-containing protein [Aspergillus pseudoustus]|uniref:Tyrosine phosphatase family-domain-containing protein n=1 Tax=Aspergillus pseudoustus TaxID=1810923 RepID=A0ABR4K4B8_9EURO